MHVRGTVVEQVAIARDTFRLRIRAPQLASRVRPGQFVMLREPDVWQPLLGRPFALYDTVLTGEITEPASASDPSAVEAFDIAYLVVGRMTERMAALRAGDEVEVWGPLGNGFPIPTACRLILVAGGIGFTPFPAVARQALGERRYGNIANGPSVPLSSRQIVYCCGARSAEYLAGIELFEQMGVRVQVATDNGTAGHRGFVTDLVARTIAEYREAERTEAGWAGLPIVVYCCGPEPMMHAVSQLAAKEGVTCLVSLETPMACGFGACFSCVTKVRQPDQSWDYRRVCVEGPVFDASLIEW